MSAPPQLSDLDLLSNGQGIVDFDTKIADGTFDLSMPEKELNSS